MAPAHDRALPYLAQDALSGVPLAVVAVALGALAVLTILMGWLGRKGKLKPNPLFGIRTRRTLSDPEEWYRVHREIAPWAYAAGAAVLGGVVAVLLVSDGALQSAILIAVAVVYVLLICLAVWRLQRSSASG
ncbi:SdpI family protein [Streptomyces sp. NPDC101150]|uniref:SdpI family protein n=1 Tax=Streptomyces sp. NPDC101150 TaxID=3366114 RepID=UPI003801A747